MPSAGGVVILIGVVVVAESARLQVPDVGVRVGGVPTTDVVGGKQRR